MAPASPGPSTWRAVSGRSEAGANGGRRKRGDHRLPASVCVRQDHRRAAAVDHDDAEMERHRATISARSSPGRRSAIRTLASRVPSGDHCGGAPHPSPISSSWRSLLPSASMIHVRAVHGRPWKYSDGSTVRWKASCWPSGDHVGLPRPFGQQTLTGAVGLDDVEAIGIHEEYALGRRRDGQLRPVG